MIRIPRFVLKRFRTLCRRGGLHKFRTSGGPFVAVAGGADGCTLRAASPDVCIQFHDPTPCEAESVRLPLDALEVCEGRDDAPVTLEIGPGNRALLSWVDRGVPRRHEVDQPKIGVLCFPELPTCFIENEVGLWATLRNAVATTDAESTRYALGCLHVRGKLGRIDATDGRQILTQTGYQLGFDDDVLIPASPLLGCRDLDADEPFRVGRNGEWLGFGVGSVFILVRIQKEGKYPKLDEILPVADRAPSRLGLSTQDATFLLDVMPSLPSSDPQHGPLTFDLNGKVLIRSRDAERAQPTEVELTSSQLKGDAVTFNADRRYVERALRLGFREAFIFGPASPVLCADDRRRYLFALLDAASAVPKSADAVRIESTKTPTALRVRRPRRKSNSDEPPVSKIPQSTVDAGQKCDAKEVEPLEVAIQLRDALRNATSAARHLVRQLKRQKRRSRVVEATLTSLRSLAG